MKISERRDGAVTVISPTGSVSGPDADQTRTRLLETFRATHGRFVVDASEIAFIDGAGLEMLLDVSEQMNRTGQGLKLCAANETLRQIMDLTGLSPLFEFFEDVNTAVRSFL